MRTDKNTEIRILGPFAEVVSLRGLNLGGSIPDEKLEIIRHGGVALQNEEILDADSFEVLVKKYPGASIEENQSPGQVMIPGFIDAHTHICFAGNRARDYALRVAGKSYLEIAKAGGGIWDSVTQTRQSTQHELANLTAQRANRLLHTGTTTIEVKSGYGLGTDSELNMLRAIREAQQQTPADLISTCLAAHMKPRDFQGSESEYLTLLVDQLLPRLKQEKLSNRIDIFIEDSAFNPADGYWYLDQARRMGFELTVHADQFSTGGSTVAVALGAVSADHLEASTDAEIKILAESNTVAVVLPGASLGLGMVFSPARKLLDQGACVAIASDWNPGSAPMGDLLTQAAVLGAYEKLSLAETLAGLTFRSAKALNLTDRGRIEAGQLADLQSYPTTDYRDIFYNQGTIKPIDVWKKGIKIK